MKLNPLFQLRVISLLTTATSNLITADLQGFAGKLAERIRLAGGPVSQLPIGWLRRIADGQSSEARRLIDEGHLTEGVRCVVEQGMAANQSDIHLAKRTVERLQLLEIPPRTTMPVNIQNHQHRVLHVLTNSKPFTNSGYTVRSHHVLKCQQRVGIDVQAVTRLAYPVLVGKIPMSSTQEVSGVAYRRLLPWRYPSSLTNRNKLMVRMVVEQARAMNATILHTTTDYTNALVVAEAANRLGIPWVYEIRGELESTWLSRRPVNEQVRAEQSEFFRLARAQETRCMHAAHAVVALSEVSKAQLIERGVAAEKISVVPNAVDEAEVGREFDQRQIRRELGLAEEAVLIGTVTAVVDYEGLDTLIVALEHLPREYKALIVGDGTARPELEDLARRLGLTDRVFFAGRQPSEGIWRWYAALDVFVVPRKDTKVTRTVTPIKPLTGMALNVPVVASDLPALREVTGERAIYVVPEKPGALARGIQSAIGVEQGGPAWVSSRTWTENGARYSKLYDGLFGSQS